MQTLAVLLLEMAYEDKHLKDEENDLMPCIKRMIRWLRSISPNDPVAARAYKVIWTILKTCAPALQKQANDLLAEEVDPVVTPTSSQYSTQRTENHGNENWRTGGFAENPSGYATNMQPGTFQPQSTEAPLEYGYTAYPYLAPNRAYASSGFGNPFVTSFDQSYLQDFWGPSVSSNNVNMDFSDATIPQLQPMQGSHMQQQDQASCDANMAFWANEHQQQD